MCLTMVLGYIAFEQEPIYVSNIKFKFSQSIDSKKIGDQYFFKGENWEIYDQQTLNAVHSYYRKNESDKFINILKGSEFLKNLYMKQTLVDNKSDKVINHIISLLDFNQIEKINSNSIELCSEKELSILSEIHSIIKNNKIIEITHYGDQELFNIIIRTPNSELSQILAKDFYTVLNKYLYDLNRIKYEDKLNDLNLKKKEIQKKYDEANFGYENNYLRVNKISRWSDEWLNVIDLLRDRTFYSDQLEEITALTGVLELRLKDHNPDFLILEESYIPKLENNNILKILLISGLFGFLLSTSIIILRRIIIDAIAS